MAGWLKGSPVSIGDSDYPYRPPMFVRKGSLFASMLILLSLFTGIPAFAAEIPHLLPVGADYDYKSDPFLLEWTFEIEQSNGEKTDADRISTLEDRLLERWKEKQTALWSALPKEKFVINASAYTAAADECGKSDGITSSGLKVAEERTLACPPQYPFGTRILIEGVGERRCEDRGGAIKGNHFDIYMQTKNQAFSFGRQNLVAEVVHK